MTRQTLVLTTCLLLLPASAWATLSPRTNPPAPAKDIDARWSNGLPPGVLAPADEPAPKKSQLVLTADTEIQLDGQPCKYQDVPKTAVVVTVEVAADKKTILKLHFKSK